MKVKRDQVCGLALIIVGIIFGYLTSQFSKPFTPEYPGPKLLPAIAVFGLVVCGAGVFVNGCRQKADDKLLVDLTGFIRIVITFVILCVYVLAMKYVGFLIASPIVLYILTTYFSKASNLPTKLWARIVFSIAVSLILYAMYVPLFGMTLPGGLLFD
ncbi:MAG: tripartite tricarboxylate transporter TctB family protein [Clostridiales bacterium]|nr:tripartite tricarboxylate transporter TctB family protein [Clostridiales bacterium]